jgi:hypothetical protein
MKNNKGYYSWIHSMKSAAMDSHTRGQQMLTEATAKKKAFDPRAFETHETRGPVAHGKPEVDPTAVRLAAQELAKTPTSAHSIELAGGDVGAYTTLRRMKHAEKLGELNKARGPVDEKPAGDVEDVVADAQDGTMADPDGSEYHYPEGGRIPSYPLAAQARQETEDIEADIAAEYADEMLGAGHGPLNVRFESLNHKIAKILNESRNRY